MKSKGLGLTIAIGGKPSKAAPPSGEVMSHDDDDDMGVSDEDIAPSPKKVAAAEEFLAAIKASDANLMAIAFDNLKDCD